MMERVQKLLTNYGYCSRRDAEELIARGRVKVNGRVISLGEKASEKDTIAVDGKIVQKEKKVYLIFHKPTGCVTALRDERYKTVMDIVKIRERVFPIGRLDGDTSGLLLLTNDGDFANRIMHPRYEIKKAYQAEIDGILNENDIKQIERGIFIEGRKTAPAAIRKVGRIYEITIHEGRNRIVRRIFKALGYNVRSLKRVKVGKLYLGGLKLGRYRHLTQQEKEKIFEH